MRDVGWQRFNDDDEEDQWEGEVLVVKQAAKAMLCSFENEEAWVPYSKVHTDSDVDRDSEEGVVGNLLIPEWLAEKKGWL